MLHTRVSTRCDSLEIFWKALYQEYKIIIIYMSVLKWNIYSKVNWPHHWSMLNWRICQTKLPAVTLLVVLLFRKVFSQLNNYLNSNLKSEFHELNIDILIRDWYEVIFFDIPCICMLMLFTYPFMKLLCTALNKCCNI